MMIYELVLGRGDEGFELVFREKLPVEFSTSF
jgi:hypothetical protein